MGRGRVGYKTDENAVCFAQDMFHNYSLACRLTSIEYCLGHKRKRTSSAFMS